MTYKKYGETNRACTQHIITQHLSNIDPESIHFWLLSFEKYNGKIGSLPTNKRNIESQIMGRFYCQNLILCLDKPQQYKGYFADIFNDFDRISSQMGTLNDI